MNPLGVSILFVICSVLITFLKNFLFDDSQTQKAALAFNKVFQLSQNKHIPIRTHYSSLYQAYNKFQMNDADKYTNYLANRQKFNQTVLSDSFRKQEKSFMCGSDFLVLTFSYISEGQENIQNIIEVYRLPLMKKVEQLQIEGSLIYPRQCKMKLFYNLAFINQSSYILISISEDLAWIQQVVKRENRDSYIDGFDFYDTIFAYWTRQKPWIISIHSTYQQVGFNNKVNLMSWKNLWMDKKTKYQIQIVGVFLTKNDYEVYLCVLYNNHQKDQITRELMLNTFIINKDITKGALNTILDIDYVTHQREQDVICQLNLSEQIEDSSFSCIIENRYYNNLRYLSYKQIFSPAPQIFDSRKFKNHAQLKNQQSDESDKVILEEIQSLQQTIRQKPNHINLILSNPSRSKKLLVKSTTPNPVLLYESQNSFYFFAFYIIQSQEMERMKTQAISINFRLTPPVSEREQEKSLRDIKWVEQSNQIIVVWGSGIQIYQYISLKTQEGLDGIAMSTIMPFIQLFATVFCILRMIWSNE